MPVTKQVEREALRRDVLRRSRVERGGDEARDDGQVHHVRQRARERGDCRRDVWESEEREERRLDAVFRESVNNNEK